MLLTLNDTPHRQGEHWERLIDVTYQIPVIDPLPATFITPIEQAEAFVAARLHRTSSRRLIGPNGDQGFAVLVNSEGGHAEDLLNHACSQSK